MFGFEVLRLNCPHCKAPVKAVWFWDEGLVAEGDLLGDAVFHTKCTDEMLDEYHASLKETDDGTDTTE